MEKEKILEELNRLFKEVLDNDHIVLTYTSVAGDVAEWDSLSHIQLVVAIEKEFSIRFTSREIQNWKNVGELVDSIFAKAK